MKLSVIVLSYNTKTLTIRCLESIEKIYKNLIGKELEIILTDNASSDQTVQAAKKLGVKIVQNKKNLGFSKGNNEGAKKATGDYLLFLNSDTEIKDDGFMLMVNFMEKNPKIGILGGKLKNPEGSTQKSAGNFYNLINLFFVLLGGERIGLARKTPEKAERVDWVSGASLMIRKDLFRNLRGFDENLFMYMEDMELCFRAKKKGFETYFFSDVSIIHKERGSSNKSFAIGQIYKGILYFYKKHKPYWQYLIVKILLILKALIAILLGQSSYKQALRFSI